MSDEYGFVYLVESELGRTKIGSTENSVPARFHSIKSNAAKLGSAKVQCAFHAYVPQYEHVEKDLQARFRAAHFDGEWYNETAEKIKELTKDIPWIAGAGENRSIGIRIDGKKHNMRVPPHLFRMFWDEAQANELSATALFHQILVDRYKYFAQLRSESEPDPYSLDSGYSTID